jgi:hypothetical protein
MTSTTISHGSAYISVTTTGPSTNNTAEFDRANVQSSDTSTPAGPSTIQTVGTAVAAPSTITTGDDGNVIAGSSSRVRSISWDHGSI